MSGATRSTSVNAGVWTLEDRAASGYHEVPVPLPAGHRQLTVRLEYDRQAGVLDLGCLDPAGGFRGWSGGARDSFTIAEAWATPGYLPGPMPAGPWRVLLGLHRVPPEGLPWRLSVHTGPAGPPPVVPPPAPWPQRPAARALPAPPGHRWLAGDLHAHTLHSDGVLGVAELARLAVASGLELLAVTDHNTISHHAELATEAPAARAAGLVLLPGQEVTTGRGHANAFGDIGWVDFRRPAADWLSTVEQAGGLLSVNHPLAADFAWLHALPDRDGGPRAPLAEIWHSGWWDRTWTAPLAWLQAFDRRTVPVGGSDFHDPAQHRPLGAPTTWVLCPVSDAREATVPVVLDALRAGRVTIGESPGGPVLLRLDDQLVAMDADGTLLCDMDGRRVPVRGERAGLPARPGTCWLEDSGGRILAISA